MQTYPNLLHIWKKQTHVIYESPMCGLLSAYVCYFQLVWKKKILRIGHLSEKQEKGDGKTEKWKERQGKMEAFKIKH